MCTHALASTYNNVSMRVHVLNLSSATVVSCVWFYTLLDVP